jgi:erythromycin esterase
MIPHKIIVCFFFTLLFLGCTPKVDEVVVPGVPAEEVFRIPATGIYPLANDQHLEVLLKEVGNASFVLLGEASTGTAEFYSWRAAITRRLVEEKGFKTIAIEGGWPAAYAVNQFVKGDNQYPALPLEQFNRWPAWRWANQEIAAFTQWLHTYNANQAPAQQVSFYGLDVYSLWESLESLRQNFPQADPGTLAAIDQAWSCLGPYNRSETAYAQATKTGGGCARELRELYEVIQNQVKAWPGTPEQALNAIQNAAIGLNAHHYYQASLQSNLQSWNIREQHMMETIDRLVNHYGPDAKIVIWASNAQVGDATFSAMADGGMDNLGKLLRKKYKDKGVYLVGLGMYQGQVLAAESWGGPAMVVPVPAAQPGSWEALLHEQGPGNKLVLLQEWRKNTELTKKRGHRDIGAVYSPNLEAGSYVPTNLPNRYDAFLYLDVTQAVQPF